MFKIVLNTEFEVTLHPSSQVFHKNVNNSCHIFWKHSTAAFYRKGEQKTWFLGNIEMLHQFSLFLTEGSHKINTWS